MKARELKKGIYWVGAKDFNVRDFHGYKTHRGSTYNAYLIIDEQIVLVDTVKEGFADEMISRIKSIIDPSRIDYVVSNHVEMDHTGALPKLLPLCPKATVVTSVAGEKGLKDHFDTSSWKFKVVKNRENLVIGARTLQFTHIPLVHWPDSMVTYVPEEKLLLPNDAFGQHLASDGLFDCDVPADIIFEEFAKYYANIVLPFNKQVERTLADLLPLDIDMIAPSHGIIWKTPELLGRAVRKYQEWSGHYHNPKKALIIYDSMWGATEKMMEEIRSSFEELDIDVTVRSLKTSHISDIMTDVLEAKYIALGTPTINTTMLPTMGAFLTYIKGLRPKNKIGFTFGSYGWNSKALEEIEEVLKGLEWQLPQNLVKIKYLPKEEAFSQLTNSIKSLVYPDASTPEYLSLSGK